MIWSSEDLDLLRSFGGTDLLIGGKRGRDGTRVWEKKVSLGS